MSPASHAPRALRCVPELTGSAAAGSSRPHSYLLSIHARPVIAPPHLHTVTDARRPCSMSSHPVTIPAPTPEHAAVPSPSVPVPIPSSSTSHARAASVGRSLSQRRQSHSQGATGLGRRPSRVTHPPPVPPRALSHDEALEALRGFLKERSSYDVFPVSFRLIVLDTTLRVRKALDVMLLYSASDPL